MSRAKVLLVIALFLMLPALTAPAARAADPAPPTTGFRAEVLANLAGVESKVLDLAGAIPADKWAWRPGEGVRSCSEVVMHIAFANYLMTSFWGVPMPAGVGRDMEKETDRAKVVEGLKASFVHLRGAINALGDAELDAPLKLFDSMDTTKRGALLLQVSHAHEHLGQLVAYARVNGVVPPWTARRQAATAAKSSD